MEYLKVWVSFRELLEPLNESERGRLFTAMLEYADTGETPELKGNERYVWPAAKQSIDNTREKSEQMRTNRIKTEQTITNDNKSKQNVSTSNSPFDKGKEKVKDINNDTAHAREDSSVGPVTVDPLIVKTQQELNGLTDTHYAALNDYRETLSDDVVSYAIDLAVGNGVRNWSYVEVILRGWLKAGVKTLGEAKAENEKHKQKLKQQHRLLRAQDYERREYNNAEMEEKLGVRDLFDMTNEEFDAKYGAIERS